MIDKEFIERVTSDLIANRAVRKRLPGGGRVHIDRQLPFLCVYRRPLDHEDVGTERFVHSEASYVTAARGEDVSELVEAVANAMKRVFGAFLVVEVWALPCLEFGEERWRKKSPAFRIFSRKPSTLLTTIESLRRWLENITLHREKAIAEIHKTESVAPVGLPPLLSKEILESEDIHMIGVGVLPVYRNESGEKLYPLALQKLRRGVAKALKHAFFRFSNDLTKSCPTHYAMLGRRLVTKVVWESDKALAEIDDSFDFLLQVTPVNTHEAWEEFKKSGFKESPRFLYRPRPFDPAHIKRRLFEIEIEKIEDPELMDLFSQKRDELDRKLTMLLDRDTPNFIYGSIPTYGRVEKRLLHTAERMLELLKHRKHENVESDAEENFVDAESFAEYARKEIAYYKKIYPPLESRVEIREDIVSGAMVSGANFLISSHAHFPKNRIEALLHHEIGTHILTYTNGKAQPFMQLHTGLRGYDEMQEGLAVLSEYLCGGITSARLRILAARVIAVNMLCEGASFGDVFKRLCDEYDFGEKSAFTVTVRVFRGGGLTKDAVYLRGLVEVLGYLHGNGPLEPLFVGKIAAEHIPLVEELQHRGILKEPPLMPRYLKESGAIKRLEEIREERLGIVDLIERGKI